MTAKAYYQKFRKLAKRGSNEMLQRAVDEVFMAGFEAGMKSLSEHLKERLHDNQSTDNGNDIDGERRKSDRTELGGSLGIDPNDANRDRGSTSTTPGPFSPGLSDLAD